MFNAGIGYGNLIRRRGRRYFFGIHRKPRQLVFSLRGWFLEDRRDERLFGGFGLQFKMKRLARRACGYRRSGFGLGVATADDSGVEPFFNGESGAGFHDFFAAQNFAAMGLLIKVGTNPLGLFLRQQARF